MSDQDKTSRPSAQPGHNTGNMQGHAQGRAPEWNPDGPPHDFFRDNLRDGLADYGTNNPYARPQNGGETPPPEVPGTYVSDGGRRMRMGQGGDAGHGYRQQAAPRADWFSAIFGHDPATRKLMGGALVLVTILLLIVGIWTLIEGRHKGIPVIAPPALPLRERPSDPGGMEIMGDDTAATRDITGKGVVHLAPQPEQPDMRILTHQNDAAGGKTGQDHIEDGTETKTGAEDAEQDDENGPVSPSVPAVVTGSPDAPPSAARKPVSMSAPEKAVTEKQVAAKPVTEKPTPKKTGHPASISPSVTQKFLPPPSTMPLPRDNSGHTGQGAYQVQLAALDSEAGAHRQWAYLKGKAPDLLTRKTPLYSRTDHNGKIFIRLRVGGFADLSAARGFCAKLHAYSVACTPAAF